MPRPPNASRQTQQLLSVLLDQPRTWRHGYELAKETGLKSGTLYPLLMRLSDQGLLEGHWREPDQPGKPPRPGNVTPDVPRILKRPAECNQRARAVDRRHHN